jgi:hypothetical protein
MVFWAILNHTIVDIAPFWTYRAKIGGVVNMVFLDYAAYILAQYEYQVMP